MPPVLAPQNLWDFNGPFTLDTAAKLAILLPSIMGKPAVFLCTNIGRYAFETAKRLMYTNG